MTISKEARQAAQKIVANTDRASKFCNGPRFNFIEYEDECAEIIQAAIDESTKEQWVPVSERLPEKSDLVLASGSNYSRPFVTFRFSTGGWADPGVTYWQPLPAPPEKP